MPRFNSILFIASATLVGLIAAPHGRGQEATPDSPTEATSPSHDAATGSETATTATAIGLGDMDDAPPGPRARLEVGQRGILRHPQNSRMNSVQVVAIGGVDVPIYVRGADIMIGRVRATSFGAGEHAFVGVQRESPTVFSFFVASSGGRFSSRVEVREGTVQVLQGWAAVSR